MVSVSLEDRDTHWIKTRNVVVRAPRRSRGERAERDAPRNAREARRRALGSARTTVEGREARTDMLTFVLTLDRK